MYAFPEMIELTQQNWKTEAHRIVATKLLIGNGRITTKDQLIEYGATINKLTETQVKTYTIDDFIHLGLPVD